LAFFTYLASLTSNEQQRKTESIQKNTKYSKSMSHEKTTLAKFCVECSCL